MNKQRRQEKSYPSALTSPATISPITLTATGCASPRTGWTPTFLTLADDAGLAAAVPLYRKDHSFGEYVFDWAWAQAHEEQGLVYYPKWLAAVPFTGDFTPTTVTP